MFDTLEYQIFYCKVHDKYIYYFKSSKILNESVCWDCIRLANLKGSKLIV